MSEVMALDDPQDRESFAIAKFFSLVQNQDQDTDEKSTDAKFRQAARSWRQSFHVLESERLVNCGFYHLPTCDVSDPFKQFTRAAMTVNFPIKDGCTFQFLLSTFTPLSLGPKPRS